ncbi:enoyl-CoA hydratase-related protein [Pseudomonas sp. MAFF 302046]|jgi:2-(1,2-epoxy-1,2-dihydrophenyl)acetyl-CoA isomerase|uniref:Enoyl-CoA hydratase-related protein n=1 Tax=Pseudomonas morbosilactucae TaxID=2938197 RepID=A0ABT0JPL7_9PSED|nr:enoyl-CoA hydratase-related protein [Pseudomonas morbosilactucae]MCK9817898.1 enoyl-CoA hydratase-related protein [Pseudomonas morbosilactucae]
MNDGVLLDLDGPVANLTLNRPQRGNAIDLSMAQTLLRAAIRCDQDPAIRCVVITGAGRLFCAGGDLGAFTASGDEVPGFLSELAGVLHLAISRLMRMAKPLVVLVNGPAAGAGMSLSLLGDIVLASGSAHFTPAYSGIGLSPDGGLSWHLPRLVGLRRAQEILLLNRRLDAAQAQDLGLITRLVDDGQLLPEGRQIAQALAAAATPALGRVRQLLLHSYGAQLEAHLEQEARSISAVSHGPQAREGLAAFIEKRPPHFHSGV